MLRQKRCRLRNNLPEPRIPAYCLAACPPATLDSRAVSPVDDATSQGCACPQLHSWNRLPICRHVTPLVWLNAFLCFYPVSNILNGQSRVERGYCHENHEQYLLDHKCRWHPATASWVRKQKKDCNMCQGKDDRVSLNLVAQSNFILNFGKVW